jgi:hypothetical protein
LRGTVNIWIGTVLVNSFVVRSFAALRISAVRCCRGSHHLATVKLQQNDVLLRVIPPCPRLVFHCFRSVGRASTNLQDHRASRNHVADLEVPSKYRTGIYPDVSQAASTVARSRVAMVYYRSRRHAINIRVG